MIAGDFPVETAMFNAALVPSIFALHVAAHKALVARARGALRTRSPYTELICNISGTRHVGVGGWEGVDRGVGTGAESRGTRRKAQVQHQAGWYRLFFFPTHKQRILCSIPQIAESLRRFGVNESCRHLLFAALDPAPDAEQLLSKLVDGTLVDDPAKLGELVDKDQLKKVT